MSFITIPPSTPIVAIRPASADDREVLERIAALDSSDIPSGELLLAVVDGEVRAAVSTETGEAIADPFHPTADIVALLHMRASRLQGSTDGVSSRRFLRSLLPAQ